MTEVQRNFAELCRATNAIPKKRHYCFAVKKIENFPHIYSKP